MRFFLACSLFASLTGCGQSPVTLREPDTYLGCGTDENWRTFDEQERAGLVKTDDAQAPRFQSPAQSGSTIAFAAKPTFTWQPTPSLAGKMNGDATCMDNCTLCNGMMPCALCGQHLAAVNGDDYDLQFSVGGAVVYRVITTLQYFTPPDDLWASWKGKSLSLAMVRVHLKMNDIDEGPFSAQRPLSFSVGN